MSERNWAELADDLSAVLHLEEPPVAIAWRADRPEHVDAFDDPMPPPLPDGRTGRVAAPCVFWMHSTTRAFSTVAADHGNCSVGLMTHGWSTLDEVAGNSDVAALVESGWVSEAQIPGIPVVRERPVSIVYSPLADTPVDPDVVLFRLNAKQLMVLSDAWPGLRLEGKPQCHVLALAKDEGLVAASVGCMLSRVRTGMKAHEMTCALPAGVLSDLIEAVQRANAADSTVAAYAAEDATRFGAPRPA